jgi:RNA polymerase sigma factor (sigma-70 family)
MAETVTFDPSSLGAEPVDFDPSSLGAEPVEEFDPSSLGAEPVETPQTFGDKASRVMANAASQTLNTISGTTRLYQSSTLGKLFDEVANLTGIPTTQEFITELEGASSRASDDYGVNPKQGDSFLSTVASGAGSLLPTLASGPLAPFTTAVSMGEQGFQEADQAGATEGQKVTAFLGNAAVGAITEKLLGIPAILKSAKAAKLPEGTLGNLVKTVVKQMGLGFAREGTQETLEQLSQDTIAAYVSAYDPDRKVFDGKKLATTFLAGGLLGGALGGTLTIAENATPDQIAPKEEMQEQASQIDAQLETLAQPPPLPTTSTGDQGVPVEPAVEETFVPTEQLVQTPAQETPPTEENLPAQQPARLSPFEPQTEGPQIISTGIMTPEGIATGTDWNSSHAQIITKSETVKQALAFGMTPEELDSNKGFIIQDESGKQRFVGRKEALEIAKTSGQVDESKIYTPEQGLISEGLKAYEKETPQTSKEVLSADQAALAIEPYREAGIAMAKRSGASDLIAEDIFQEVQNELYPKLASGEIQPNKLGGLISKAVREKTLNKIKSEQARSARQEAVAPPEVTTVGPRAETVVSEDVKTIEQALDKLPGNQGKAIRLTAEGKTNAQIASELGITEGAVEQTKARARQAMKEFIRSMGIGERLAPGAANELEFRRARYIAATDIYRSTENQTEFEREMSRIYEDTFTPEDIRDAYKVAQFISEQKGTKSVPDVVSQLLGIQKTGEGITAIKNKQVDAERKARGEPPLMSSARKSEDQLWDEMVRKMEEDRNWQGNLLDRLRQNPRTILSDVETMAVLHAKIEADNDYAEATKAVNEAKDDRTRLEAQGRRNELAAKLGEIETISRMVGTEQGRALAARKMLVTKDYSVARLAADLQADQQGEPLTKQQTELVQEVSDKIQETEAKIETRTEELDSKASREEYEKAVSEMISGPTGFDQKILEIAEKIVSKLDQAANSARKRIQSRLGRVNTGLDPTFLYDYAVIGASKIAHGLRDLAWKNAMRSEFGDHVEPYLDAAYDQANARLERLEEEIPQKQRAKVKQVVRKEGSQDEMEKTSKTIKSRLENGEGMGDLRAQVQKLALSVVRSGVTTPDGLLDAVQGVLEPLQPGITKREVQDLISGYGDLRALDMETAKVQLRDLKGQFQQLSKLEDLQKGREPKKTGIERRKPSQAEKTLVRQVNEAREKFGVGTLDAYKARLQNSIADLQIRIDRKDFRKKIRNLVDISRDAEAVRLLAENERWKKKFQDERYKAKKSAETKLQTATRYGKEILNVPRAIKSSLDFSGVLRQGGFIGLGNPARALKNIPSMFKSAFSQEAFERSEAQIRSRPNAPLYKQAKLYLADMDGDLSNREEMFRSELSERIPGVKQSNRAFIGYLNRMRADTFDALVGNLGFTPTPEQLKAIAHYVNVATGRGDLGAHGAAAETLSTVLWSPRLLVSRIQLLAGEPLARGDAKGVRSVIAKEYAKTIAAGAVILSLAAMWGIDVEDDPRSSDFGKLRIGESRIDPWMGLQQLTVLGSRLASGETRTLGGDIKAIRGEDKPAVGSDAFDISMRFVRSKMTPLLGEFFNVVSGENVIGEKVTPVSTAKGLLAPLSLSDLIPMLEDQGISRTAALTLLNVFGASVQHHQEQDK